MDKQCGEQPDAQRHEARRGDLGEQAIDAEEAQQDAGAARSARLSRQYLDAGEPFGVEYARAIGGDQSQWVAVVDIETLAVEVGGQQRRRQLGTLDEGVVVAHRFQGHDLDPRIGRATGLLDDFQQ